MPRLPSRTALKSFSFLSVAFSTTGKKMDAAATTGTAAFPIRSYAPKPAVADGPFPYSAADMTPMDAGNDTAFYRIPRFVTHIDDNAIASVRQYYDTVLPRKGRILDFCSSWVSHYPSSVQKAAQYGELEVLGTGMNRSELSQNPVLKAWTVQDLNEDPEVKLPADEQPATAVPPTAAGAAIPLDATTCVVSIDYLTKPVEVLASIRRQTNQGGKVHLVISNRCFPTKVVGRWLKVGEEERLEMVGDYLWWSGWREIETVTVVKGTWTKDPLWVVRGTNTKT